MQSSSIFLTCQANMDGLLMTLTSPCYRFSCSSMECWNLNDIKMITITVKTTELSLSISQKNTRPLSLNQFGISEAPWRTELEHSMTDCHQVYTIWPQVEKPNLLTFSSDSDIQLLLGPQMVPRPHVRALIRRSTTIDHTKAISLTSWYTVKGYQFLPPPSPLSTHSRPMKPCPGDRPAVRLQN